jgi:hypothetical protein
LNDERRDVGVVEKRVGEPDPIDLAARDRGAVEVREIDAAQDGAVRGVCAVERARAQNPLRDRSAPRGEEDSSDPLGRPADVDVDATAPRPAEVAGHAGVQRCSVAGVDRAAVDLAVGATDVAIPRIRHSVRVQPGVRSSVGYDLGVGNGSPTIRRVREGTGVLPGIRRLARILEVAVSVSGFAINKGRVERRRAFPSERVDRIGRAERAVRRSVRGILLPSHRVARSVRIERGIARVQRPCVVDRNGPESSLAHPACRCQCHVARGARGRESLREAVFSRHRARHRAQVSIP